MIFADSGTVLGVVGFAAKKKVTLCMEMLNSKVNHKDYLCDHMAWGVKLAKKLVRRDSNCCTTSITIVCSD